MSCQPRAGISWHGLIRVTYRDDLVEPGRFSVRAPSSGTLCPRSRLLAHIASDSFCVRCQIYAGSRPVWCTVSRVVGALGVGGWIGRRGRRPGRRARMLMHRVVRTRVKAHPRDWWCSVWFVALPNCKVFATRQADWGRVGLKCAVTMRG